MNKYDDKTLDINLEVSRKMATMGNLAIKATTKQVNGKVSLFEPGALDRVTRLAKQIAGDELKVDKRKQEEIEFEIE